MVTCHASSTPSRSNSTGCQWLNEPTTSTFLGSCVCPSGKRHRNTFEYDAPPLPGDCLCCGVNGEETSSRISGPPLGGCFSPNIRLKLPSINFERRKVTAHFIGCK